MLSPRGGRCVALYRGLGYELVDAYQHYALEGGLRVDGISGDPNHGSRHEFRPEH